MTDERMEIIQEAGIENVERTFLEVGGTAVWSVSSAKHGNGVMQLRDDDPATYWQSDGMMPHTISVDFPKLTPTYCVAILLNYAVDESYTPKKIVVRAGTHSGDIAQVGSADVEAPNGWILIHLLEDGTATKQQQKQQRVWCTTLQIVIPENHQNGRDTHIRSVKVFSPRLRCAYSSTQFAYQHTLR